MGQTMGLGTSDGRQAGNRRLVLRTPLVATAGVIVGVLAFSGAPALAAPPETPVTKPASAITATGATLNGELNPLTEATAGFQFTYNTNGTCIEGTTTELGAEATGTKIAVSTPLSGLEPSKEYTFCVVATHEAESPSSGGALKFKTLGVKPKIDSEGTSAVKSTSATLEAQVNPNNQETTYSFEYATNKALTGATTVAGSEPLAAGPVDQTASVATGAVLTPGELYYYRVVATNATGVNSGAVQSFTTIPTPTTDPVSGLTATTVTFNGHLTLDPVATQFSFDYKLGGECTGESATGAGEAGIGSATVAEATEATGLQPSRAYTACFLTSNAFGSELGAPVPFTTLPAPPTVASESVSARTTTDAMLEAKINPNNQETTYFFEYATEEAPLLEGKGIKVKGAPPLPALTAVFEEQLAGPVDIGGGLTPGQTYFYRVIAENASLEKTEGPVQSFAALPVAPLVTLGATPVVTRTAATVSGVINPEGATTEYFIEYGQAEPHGAPGSPTPLAKLEAHGLVAATTAPQTLNELKPASTYRYRIVAINEAGTTPGPEGTFTTEPAQPPTAATGEPLGVSQTAATITGMVNPDGLPTTYVFEVGIDTGYGTRSFGEAGSQATGVSLPLTGLLPSTTYHYRIVATNQDGTSAGADHTFTTPGYASPIAAPPQSFALLTFTAPTEPPAAPVHVKPLTRAQKLARALKACAKQPKKKRAACRRQAKRKYR
jgi:hypothetical protein